VDAFELVTLVEKGEQEGPPYRELLRVPSMNMGVYRLKAGARDPQTPHTEDEAYFVTRGRGSIRVGSEERTVGPGSVIFVKAGVEHRFHDVREDFVVLVFFAPAEGSAAGVPSRYGGLKATTSKRPRSASIRSHRTA